MCANFYDNLSIWWLKKWDTIEKNSYFLNYGFSYTFRDMRVKYPLRYCPENLNRLE